MIILVVIMFQNDFSFQREEFIDDIEILKCPLLFIFHRLPSYFISRNNKKQNMIHIVLLFYLSK